MLSCGARKLTLDPFDQTSKHLSNTSKLIAAQETLCHEERVCCVHFLHYTLRGEFQRASTGEPMTSWRNRKKKVSGRVVAGEEEAIYTIEHMLLDLLEAGNQSRP